MSAEVAAMIREGRLRSFLQRHRFTRFFEALSEARQPYRSRKVSVHDRIFYPVRRAFGGIRADTVTGHKYIRLDNPYRLA